MTASVIIPTKNRCAELMTALRSIATQTRPPDELIVVDQSAASGEPEAKKIWNGILRYIHAPRITGASMARNRGIECAHGDVLIFVDDDEVLEPDYVAELLKVYADHLAICGVSGVPTNYGRPPLSFRAWYRLSHLGVFYDDRQPLYWRAQSGQRCVAHVSRFGGGVMSFRAAAIRHVRFDERLTGACFGEDVDFSWRFGRTHLMMTSHARLQHNHSADGRQTEHWMARMLRADIYLYHRNWQSGVWNRVSYVWCVATYWASFFGRSLRERSLQPLRSFGAALAAGKQDACAGREMFDDRTRGSSATV